MKFVDDDDDDDHRVGTFISYKFYANCVPALTGVGTVSKITFCCRICNSTLQGLHSYHDPLALVMRMRIRWCNVNKQNGK